MEKILNEIKKSLDYGLYYSALVLTLSLPDICGRAEFSEKYKTDDVHKNRKWYKRWFSTYLRNSFLTSTDMFKVKGFNSSVCWELRNSVMHSGNNKTTLKSLKLTSKDILQFKVVSVNGRWEYTLELGVKYFCEKICEIAEQYYKNNKEKFDFLTDIITE